MVLVRLSPDFLDFFRTLNAVGVRYLVIGGYAVAFHGYPRATKDVDLWVETDPENAKRVLKALQSFFGEDLGLSLEDLTTPGVVQLGRAPNRIDLVLIPEETASFSAAYEARETLEIEGVPVPFVDLETLKVLKRAFGRTQDLADLEALE